ncbi:hypothetical protein NBRC116590_16950 [Pelagimonas sp. KU-00592-HH]|uniref:hypothetical protein n=1 Tax=Pelagimonas sp. KU-00592-HH TaxID=3127651 RepID=UPI00310666AE
MLDNAMQLDVNSKKVVTPDATRAAVAHLVEVHQVKQRRVRSALEVGRSTEWFQSRRSNDTDLRDAIKEVAYERRRCGCRRLYLMTERQCWPLLADLPCKSLAGQGVNHKTFRQIYREKQPQVRR